MSTSVVAQVLHKDCCHQVAATNGRSTMECAADLVRGRDRTVQSPQDTVLAKGGGSPQGSLSMTVLGLGGEGWGAGKEIQASTGDHTSSRCQTFQGPQPINPFQHLTLCYGRAVEQQARHPLLSRKRDSTVLHHQVSTLMAGNGLGWERCQGRSSHLLFLPSAAARGNAPYLHSLGGCGVYGE